MKLRQTKNKRILQLLPVFLLLSFSLMQGMRNEKPPIAIYFDSSVPLSNEEKASQRMLEELVQRSNNDNRFLLQIFKLLKNNDLEKILSLLQLTLPPNIDKQEVLNFIKFLISTLAKTQKKLETAIQQNDTKKIYDVCNALEETIRNIMQTQHCSHSIQIPVEDLALNILKNIRNKVTKNYSQSLYQYITNNRFTFLLQIAFLAIFFRALTASNLPPQLAIFAIGPAVTLFVVISALRVLTINNRGNILSKFIELLESYKISSMLCNATWKNLHQPKRKDKK